VYLIRLGRLAARAMLFHVVLVLSAAAAEGLTRWLYRDVTTTSDFRGFFTNRWLRTAVRHNHYDYRGGEFSEIKPAGVYRVAVIGDSFAYGNGIPEETRFSNLLDVALRQRGVEVLNFGFPGTNWPEHVTTLERRVLRLAPDFVLLQWGINDIERDQDVAARPRVPPILPVTALHDWLYTRSAFYTLLNAQWTRFHVVRQMGDSYSNYLTRLHGHPRSEGALAAARWMKRFVEVGRSGGAQVGIVLFPDAGVDLGRGYPYQFLHDQLQTLCREENIQCLDLLPAYRAVPDRRTLWASALDPHPSSRANRIAADEILKVFGASWQDSHR